MKKIFLSISPFIFVAFSAVACPEITGNYQCAEEAADPMVFGTREVQFKKSPVADIYSMKIKNSSSMYEVGSWNPGIDPNTGEIDQQVETKAECEGNKALLYTKASQSEGGIDISVTQVLEVTPRNNGVGVRLLVEGDEFIGFDCQKN